MSERNIDRKIRFFSFAVAATLFAFVSAATGDEKELEPNYMPLNVLILDHAEADANEAISHGDLRFLAVQGYSLEIPGVTGDVSKIEATYGIKILSGTSDVIENNEHQRLDVNAREYALRYNNTLLANVPK